jgi:exopolysaccharide production protein ExoY
VSTENLTIAAEPAGLTAVSYTHPQVSLAKRVIDITVASVGLVLALPLMAIIGAVVFLSSPGRVTFRQERVGLHGNTFRILKFRSMVADAEKRLQTDPALREIYLRHGYKVPAHLDSRLTRVGRFLRKTSLDELPQLWNVIVGDMSLVGPRPVVPDELSYYGALAPVYESVRPGLTGPWQANGRTKIGYDQRVLMDADYVSNWSLRDDVKIILKTIPAVLKRQGAH